MATNHSKIINRSRSPGSKSHSKKSFASIMNQATRGMPSYRRAFSRLIHKSAISSLSDFLGNILMRPNAILAGAICSFSFTIATYLLAKNFGYSLSGFETIGAFIVGWVAGNIFDLLVFATKKK